MSESYTYSKKQPVFYNFGSFNGDVNAKRFIQAPFDVVTINGVLYLQPRSFRYDSPAVAQTSVVDADQVELARQDCFFTDINPVVVNECEMGCKDDSVSWKGMHRFGHI